MFRNPFSSVVSGMILFPLITFLFSANFLPVSVILGHFQEPVGEAKLGLVSPSLSTMIKHEKHYKSKQKVQRSTDTNQCCEFTQQTDVTDKALACDWLAASGKCAHWLRRFSRWRLQRYPPEPRPCVKLTKILWLLLGFSSLRIFRSRFEINNLGNMKGLQCI